jgi:hypothetical protein
VWNSVEHLVFTSYSFTSLHIIQIQREADPIKRIGKLTFKLEHSPGEFRTNTRTIHQREKVYSRRQYTCDCRFTHGRVNVTN